MLAFTPNYLPQVLSEKNEAVKVKMDEDDFSQYLMQKKGRFGKKRPFLYL